MLHALFALVAGVVVLGLIWLRQWALHNDFGIWLKNRRARKHGGTRQ